MSSEKYKIFISSIVHDTSDNTSEIVRTITITLEKKQDEIIISIQDEGDGIKEEDINNIFTKYYTSAKKYSNIGVGLGLYIANKIIIAHGGKIKAKNNKDKGACFSIVLPKKNC